MALATMATIEISSNKSEFLAKISGISDEQLVSDVVEPSVDTTSLLTGLTVISAAFVLLVAILVVCQCHTYRCHVNMAQYHRYGDENDPEITSIVSRYGQHVMIVRF